MIFDGVFYRETEYLVHFSRHGELAWNVGWE
jgi:hypothetical protein